MGQWKEPPENMDEIATEEASAAIPVGASKSPKPCMPPVDQQVAEMMRFFTIYQSNPYKPGDVVVAAEKGAVVQHHVPHVVLEVADFMLDEAPEAGRFHAGERPNLRVMRAETSSSLEDYCYVDFWIEAMHMRPWTDEDTRLYNERNAVQE